MSEFENNYNNIPEEPIPEKRQPEVKFENEPAERAEYSVPGKRPAYSDAGYVSSDEAAAVPPRYNVTAADKPRKEKKKKEKRGVGVAGVIALCLVCAILGGAAGMAGGVYGSGFFGKPASTDRPEKTEPPVLDVESGESDTVINVVEPNKTQVSTNVVDPGEELDPTELYNLACQETVAITTEITYTNFWGMPSSSAVSGSGFIISSNGYILTNYHVIENAVAGGYEISVFTYDGTEYIASVVGHEEDNDIAVLKIEAEGLDAVTIGSNSTMMVGEDVYAVGNPLGELQYTMTDGIVSALDREISTENATINMFQISAAVNSGNSGGPLYNSRGEVIGVVAAKYADTGVEGLGFAIPIDDAIDIANQLMTQGYVSGKAYMGIVADTVTASVAQYYNMVVGAYVYSIEPDSCAAECGLKVGDIIVALDGTTITSSADLVAAKKSYRAGDSAELKVYREGDYLDLTIVFDEEVPQQAMTNPSTPQYQPGAGLQRP